MTRLHELAAKYGIETRKEVEKVGSAGEPVFKYPLRPDLEIAMELLAKLPAHQEIDNDYLLMHEGANEWRLNLYTAQQMDSSTVYASIIEAVIALAERQEGI